MDEKELNNEESYISEESYLKDNTVDVPVHSTKVVEKTSNNKAPMIIMMVITLLLCTLSSYFTAKYVASKYSSEPTVIYEAVPTNTVVYETADLSNVVSQIENSVVEVYTESVKYNAFYGEYVTSGAGSGVVYTSDGYIITNNHVIDGAKTIRVTMHDGTDYSAVLIGKDADTDLAVIKIEATCLTPVLMGTSGSIKVGETCIAIGNPLGTLGGTVTSGIISALSREITVDGQKMTLLQTNTTINPGNSGGGLFDVSGNLIGIVNAKYSSTEIEGIGFAIPVDVVKTICEDLMKNGRVTGRASIGIKATSIENDRMKAYYGVSNYGVLISEITLDSAKQAGLRKNDLIIKLGDYEIASYNDLKDALTMYKAGDKVEIIVMRNNQEVSLNVVLAERQ